MHNDDIDQRIERLRAECERRLRGRYELTLAQDGIEICAELTQLRHDFRELNEIQKAWSRAFNEAERRAGLDSLACVPDSAFPLHEKIDAMRAELERLQIELPMYKRLYDHALDCVDRVFQIDSTKPEPILPDFCNLGDDKFYAVVELAQRFRDQEVELERLRAELNEWRDYQKAVLAEPCAGIAEDHCVCVPALRREVDGQRNRADALTHHCTGLEAELERLREDNERLHETMTKSPAMRARYDDGRQEELERLRAVVDEQDRLLLSADVALYHVVRFVSGCDTESMDVIRNTWNEIKEHRAAEAAKEATT